MLMIVQVQFDRKLRCRQTPTAHHTWIKNVIGYFQEASGHRGGVLPPALSLKAEYLPGHDAISMSLLMTQSSYDTHGRTKRGGRAYLRATLTGSFQCRLHRVLPWQQHKLGRGRKEGIMQRLWQILLHKSKESSFGMR